MQFCPMCVWYKFTNAVVVCEQHTSGSVREQTVDGDSYVGNVNSNGGQLRLNRSNGNANSNNGVGVSMRLNCRFY